MRVAAAMVVTALAVAGLAGPAASTTEVSDTLSVVKDDEAGISNVEVALRLSLETPSSGDTIVVSRDDEFADALASGVLQDDAPLLLVPRDGPLPADVREHMVDLSPARAVVLGGTAAVSDAVAAELAGLGMAVERRAGGSRFDTAVAIAEADAATADTVMLARAFPAPGSPDPTQAFADTLAAGGLAAREGWPILLTETDQLTGPTAAYLARSGASRVLVLGGTAAISDAVFAEAVAIVGTGERVAGADRFATGVEIAKVGGDDTAADVAHALLVEGSATPAFTQATTGGGPDAWAGGFAAAHRAAVFDAPILLTNAGQLPQPTADFLAPGITGDATGAPLLTCVMSGPACEAGRVTAGLPEAVDVTVTPMGGGLAPGQAIIVAFGDYDGPATVGGTCLDGAVARDGTDDVRVVAARVLPQPTCTLVVSGIDLGQGTTQTETSTFATDELALAGTIDPPDVGGMCALAVDPAAGLLYGQACSADDLVRRFTFDGQPAVPATFPSPTGASNDLDFDVIDQPTTILGQSVPGGSLLILDSEGPPTLVVLDPVEGTVLAGPVTPQLPGQAVGVAWDAPRREIVAASWDVDVISRLDANTAQEVAAFPVAPEGTPPYDIFFGDVEVACDGTLVIVSNSTDVIRTLTPDGELVADRQLAEPPVSLQNSGIALDDTTGTGYIATNGGTGIIQVISGLVGPC
ncbi:MAG TPA: cell wall-binding repeat-containing protein [Euzebya sp.]|nr:cell wall-binding repeat-containing protein [Euzebya sp.]